MPIPRTILTLILSVLLAAACSRPSSPDRRLARIADFVSDEPRRAADSLRCVDPSALSPADRALFGLLSVKAADKAFVRHTSDSLILSVIGHYQSSPPSSPLLLPEALYYGGRVTSDLGDYPRALRYFHDALSALPSDDTSRSALDLRARILGQTAFLLRTLRLYSEATPYVRESISIDHVLADSLALAEDLKLLGLLRSWTHDYQKADSAFSKAFEAAGSLSDADRADIQGEWADLKRKQGDVDSALSLISCVPQRVDAPYKSYHLLTAAEIYYDASMFDSAFIYSRSVIDSESDPVIRTTAYRLLLKPSLRAFSPAESLMVFVDSLNVGLLRRENNYNAEATIIQNAAYNYSSYEKANESLVQRHSRLLILIAVSFCVVLVLLLLRFMNLRKIDNLRTEIFRLRTLRRHVGNSDEEPMSPSEFMLVRETVSSLRLKLADEVRALADSATVASEPLEAFLSSPVFASISSLVADGKAVHPSDPVWDRLGELVCSVSPDFLVNLSLLAGNSLSPDDIHLALLIKAGFSPSQTAILMGRTRGTLTYRRRQLFRRVFRNELPFDKLDALIRSL